MQASTVTTISRIVDW